MKLKVRHEVEIGSAVYKVAVTADSKSVATGSEDGTVRLFDLASGELIRTYDGHTAGVYGVTFTPDQTKLVTGSWDHDARVWDVESGECIYVLGGRRGHKSWIFDTATDGEMVLTASSDSTLKKWDLATGKYKETWKGHGSYIFQIKLTPNMKKLVSCSRDWTVIVWDVETGEPEVYCKDGHKNDIFTVAVSPDGKYAASGSSDMNVCLWDISRGELVKKLFPKEEIDQHTVNAVTFSNDGKFILVGSRNNTIQVWDHAKEELVDVFERHHTWVRTLGFSPDSKILVSGSDDKYIVIWDVE
jgi:WD40 repeat protein